jgi:glutamate-5-semialdehyde dehydrogenase
MSFDLQTYANRLGESARRAGLSLAATSVSVRTRAIVCIARRLRESTPALLEANAKDVDAAKAANLSTPVVKRLMLDAGKIDAMARAVEEIAAQPDPIGHVIESKTRTDGLRIDKVRVPIGVVLFCYESRPNVTTDAAALCLRSGNAVILRGGKESIHSNAVLAKVIAEAVDEAGLDPASVQVVETTDRALLPRLLKLDRYIDVVIPRGGESLIRAVVDDAVMPVLKHFTGNCHIYIDHSPGELRQLVDVVVNAKTSYPGGAACNAVEHVLVHRDVADRVLPDLVSALKAKQVEVRGDDAVRQIVPGVVTATDADWDEEYLAFVIGIKVVDGLDAAIDHINRHGSHHTDAILSDVRTSIDTFVKRVDSASVIVNASTRLADGGEYGLGAEIGISTDKLHARGPMGAFDMTTYKWVVIGSGHLR